MQAIKKSGYVYWVSVIAAFSGLLFGFDTGIISGALLFIEKDFPVTTVMKELIVSSVLLGAMLGSLCSGRLTDGLGRRPVICLVALTFILGTFISSFAPTVNMILAGRLLIGVAIGIGSYTAPLYIAEMAPYELRGGLVSFNQLAISIGILVSYIINYTFTDSDASWRLMFGIGFIPAILLGLGMIFLPESPRWLIKNGRIEKAQHILQRLRGKVDVSHEVNEIKDSLQIKQTSFKEVFAPWIRPVLFLGAMLGLIQQVTGINTIIYYAPTIFQMAGSPSVATSILATVGIGVVNVLATIFAVLYLDKIGRRPLLITGLIGMLFSLSGLSLTFYLGTTTLIAQAAALAYVFVFIISFAFSLGAALWLLVSEIFPLEVRATAMGVAVFSCWLWNFAVSSTFLSLLNALGPSLTFSLYAFMCLLSLIFCYYKVPETCGVTLEQIENNIRQGKPLRYIGRSDDE